MSARALLELAGAEIHIAAVFSPVSHASGLVVPVYVTSGPRLYTEPDDAPASVGFRAAVNEGWVIERALNAALTFGGKSGTNTSSLTVDVIAAGLESWRDLGWEGNGVAVRAGGPVDETGSFLPYESWEPIFDGVVKKVTASAGGKLVFELAGRKILCDQPWTAERYRGFGGALLVERKASSDAAVAVHDASMNVDGAGTLEWGGVVHAINTSPSGIIAKGQSPDTAFAFYLLPTGDIAFQSGANSNRVSTSGYSVPLGERLVLSATCTEGGEVEIKAGADADHLAVVASGNLGSGLGFQSSANPVSLAEFSGSATRTADVEFHFANVWDHVRTADQLRADLGGPVASPKTQPGLVMCWKFNDGAGSVARSEMDSSHDFSLTGGTWRSTLTGDDPEQWGASALGKTVPDGWGRQFGVPGVLVDSQFHVYQLAAAGALTDIERLWLADGTLLVPDETISAAAGQLTFSAAAKTITLGGSLSAHRLVPGQAEPARTGQRIDISGTASNDGTLTIAADGVSADGKVVTVVEALTDETTAGAATIVSTAADVDFAYDVSAGTVDFPQTPEGEFRAQIVGRGGGAVKVSEVVTEVVGEAPQSSLSRDPVVGWHLASAQDVVPRCSIVEQVLDSAAGWWAEDPDGSFRIGSFGVPSGDPAAVVVGSPALTVGVTAPIVGRIEDISPPTVVTPSWQLLAGYSRNWGPLDVGGFAGSVSGANRTRYSEEYLWTTPRSNTDLRSGNVLSQPLPPLLTALVDRASAELLLDDSAGFFSRARRWWLVTVGGMGMLALKLYDTIYLQHPDPVHGLTSGVLAKVTYLKVDTSTDLTEMGVHD